MERRPFPLSLPRRVGQYTFTEVMATTGMSWLLLGTDPWGVRVVGKVAAPGTPDSLIADEAAMMRRLSHYPQFLVYRDFLRTEGLPVLVYNYQHGVDLHYRRATEGPLGLFHVLRIGKEVARALEVCATLRHPGGGFANVVHRDIKPANILWTDDGRAILMDFGVGLWRGRTTPIAWSNPDTIVGSPAYLAPEQITQRAIVADHRSDIFSLGLVLWETAMGEHFFRGETTYTVMCAARDVEGREDRLRELRARNADLATVVGRCVERRLRDRYQHPKALREALSKVRISRRR